MQTIRERHNTRTTRWRYVLKYNNLTNYTSLHKQRFHLIHLVVNVPHAANYEGICLKYKYKYRLKQEYAFIQRVNIVYLFIHFSHSEGYTKQRKEMSNPTTIVFRGKRNDTCTPFDLEKGEPSFLETR